ncbi:MAG: alkane 1-monooxygenase [Flavobacteriaceae bacterium]|nr:alkane 1-monooxygenase [Flavobacteriaceae bacterium]
MKDLKYLIAYTLPLAAVLGMLVQGYWVFLTPAVAFILVPVLELLLPVQTDNLTATEVAIKNKNILFDWLLYLNIPITYFLVVWLLFTTATSDLELFELIGLTISVGIVVGSNGINVAHELGHRTRKWERFLGKLLLLPALYMHFYIEHNFGHHQHAATPEDPATARFNQSIYSFWFTSIVRQYINAWKIQLTLLSRNGSSFFSISNDMLWYTCFQLLYLWTIFIFLGSIAMFVALGVAVIAVLLLETINYIEHYGLVRLKKASGRYQRVAEIHSWNSNHVLGRMMLYELTRHSDHHYKSHKKYQLLEYHDVSPQMPFGYPTSMVIAMLPPLWFAIMNGRIPLEMRP